MKFSWMSPDGTGRMGVRAEPQHYDAFPPLSQFFMDSTPFIFEPDLFMVAATLLFQPWVSGQIELDNGVSPAAAGAVKQYMGDSGMYLHPIDMEPRAMHRGSITLFVTEGSDDQVPPRNGRGLDRWLTLECARIDRVSGVFASAERIIVPTNGFLLSEGSGLQAKLADVACGVLMAATCQADDIVVAGIDDSDPLFGRVSTLLGGIGLGFGSLEQAAG